MKDYFDLIWNERQPYFLLDYDRSLNKAINIKNLINRVNAGNQDNIIIEEDEDVHPSIIRFNVLKDLSIDVLRRTRLNTLHQNLEDLKCLWNTQSLLFDYETDPYLKIYGSYSIGKTVMYNLGITTIMDKSGKSISPLTLNKAIAASAHTNFISLTMTDQDSDKFNFSKFLQGQ